MQVKLIQSEIHQALIDFIAKKGIDINGQISIDITAGRKENGLFAEVDINYGVGSCAPVTTPANSVGCCNDTLAEAAPAVEAPTPWEDEAKEEAPTDMPEEAKADKPLFGN